MLVLHRRIGEAVVIEDVRVTLVQVTAAYCEVAFQKLAGGRRTVATLPHHEFAQACYDTRLVFLGRVGTKATLGIDASKELRIVRDELREA
ncbi:MAG: carbon storage regulator [Planctomycetaceae bacterium]